MTTLASLLHHVPTATALGPDVGVLRVEGIACDSRRVERGFVFFAFAGEHHDGNQYAAEAVRAGAVAIVSEQAPAGSHGVPWIQVEHGRRALGHAAAAFHADVLRVARFIGITGTNGKTTSAWLVDAVLRHAGELTGLIGTVHYRLADEQIPAANTTPESVDVLRMASRLVATGGRYLTMEVSSHALALGRVHAIPYEVAAFTNFTQDHLDFHVTLDKYYKAKCALFQSDRARAPRAAVLNADDSAANQTPIEPSTELIRFGFNETANLRALHIASELDGLRFDVEWQGKRMALASPLIGEFNVYNLLTAYGICLALGISREQIHAALALASEVPGRFERVDRGQPFAVVVDYAHTPDALRNVLQAARRLKPRRVITVFGCGGDRDRGKRPRMGEAAASLSDVVILTSDNPRTEDPKQILNDALEGLSRFDVSHVVEPDRAIAIHAAVNMAEDGDLVLIAGKGHETYQVFRDKTIHFDDRETAGNALAARGFQASKEGSR